MTVRGARCVVESMNYSACGLAPGDYFDVDADGLHLPDGTSFCFFAITAVLPLLNGRIGESDAEEWLASRPHVQCPDPPEALRMRLEPLVEHTEKEKDAP